MLHKVILSLRPLGFLVTVLFVSILVSSSGVAETPSSIFLEERLIFTGSTTLSNLVTYWGEAFSAHNPGVRITIADPGSAVGMEALLHGTAHAVLISTHLSWKQQDRFINRFGYLPTLIPVAMDGVAIYVNTLNPLPSITLKQLDAIFSATRRCGARQPLRMWKELGLKGSLGNKSITPVGLTVDSGSHQVFRHVALCDGDFRPDYHALIGPAAVEALLASDSAAIGFSSSTQRSAAIRSIPIAPRPGEPAIAPTPADIRSGRYPMRRTLAIALNQPTGRTPALAMQAFLDFVRSAEGQALASRAGYVSLPVSNTGSLK